MPNIFERFDMRGVVYCEIHFKVTPFARDLIIHYYRDGVEINKVAYDAAVDDYKRLLRAS